MSVRVPVGPTFPILPDLLHFGDGLTWRANDIAQIANAPDGITGQPYTSFLAAAGGIPPYTWFVSGSLPPGLQLAGPQNWQAPVMVARHAASSTPQPTVNLNVTQQIPTGSRLILALGGGTGTSASPAPFTDTAGNNYTPYSISGFNPTQAQTTIYFWESETTAAITTPFTLSVPTTGFSGGFIAALIWIPGAISAFLAGRGATAIGNRLARLPTPMSNPSEVIVSFCRGTAPNPIWVADSGTQQLDTSLITGPNNHSIVGVNYPDIRQASPVALWNANANWSLACLPITVNPVSTSGAGIVTSGSNAMTGIPTTSGTYNFSLTVTDSSGLTSSALQTVVIS